MPLSADEIADKLEYLKTRVDQARQYLNFEQLRNRIGELEAASAAPDFWDDADRAREHMRRLTQLKQQVEPWETLDAEVSDALELAEMAGEDPSLNDELGQSVEAMLRTLDRLETRALMSEPADSEPAYLYIHAGAGGTESCDWAEMLLRMYTRWTERQGFEAGTIELVDGDEAGIRSATLLIKGAWAYGLLKGEIGVHRLVRISPFDAAKRRHTSFCSVDAWPDIDDDVEIEIKEEDLKIDTYRSGGAGGQHVNKTSSAVRITHLPTKTVVQCQNERSQHQNKATAMKMLRSKLFQLREEERKAEQAAREGAKTAIGWGNQIRSYVFQPYQMVKDLRTGHETGNIQAVMDGALDDFMEAYLRWAAGMPEEA